MADIKMGNVGLVTKQKNPFATKSVIDILNLRIENEEYSSRFYEAMAMWLNDKGFMGAYKQWISDSADEMAHAKWAKEYLLDMGVQPKIPALKEPPQTFKGLDDIIYKSYEHEVMVTTQCNDLAKQAMKDGDHLLYQLANKFLQEQQEELGKLQTLMDKLETFGTDKIALRLLDNELAEANEG
jgi:ferritin